MSSTSVNPRLELFAFVKCITLHHTFRTHYYLIINYILLCNYDKRHKVILGEQHAEIQKTQK